MSYGILNAYDFFLDIRDNWWSRFISLVDELSKENYLEKAKRLDDIVGLRQVDGEDFKWVDWQIQDNDDRFCCDGTILDIKDERSDIYIYWKKLKYCVVALVWYIENESDPVHFLPEFEKLYEDFGALTPANLIIKIKELKEQVFSQTGVYSQALIKAQEGTWKL